MNLLLVVLGVIVEIAVWIGVAQFISGWYVFSGSLLLFIGLTLIRNSTAGIMPQLQQMQMTGQLGNDPTVTKN